MFADGGTASNAYAQSRGSLDGEHPLDRADCSHRRVSQLPRFLACLPAGLRGGPSGPPCCRECASAWEPAVHAAPELLVRSSSPGISAPPSLAREATASLFRERHNCVAKGRLIALQRYLHRRRKQRGARWAWRDFRRDWHRWTTAERVSAASLGILVPISLFAAILLNLHPI
jgi:hypothetical protein